MKKWIAIATLLLGGVAAAQSAPLTFRTDHMEETMQEFKAHHPNATCGQIIHDRCDLDDSQSHEESVYTFTQDGRLKHIKVYFFSGDFPVYAKAATDKYGKPASASEDTLQNGFGARLQNRIFEWQNVDGSRILMEERDAEEPTQGYLWIMDNTLDPPKTTQPKPF